MSAADHRAHAAAETAKADQHLASYDPTAGDEVAAGGPFGYSYGISVYNPTGHHRDAANEHRDHAEAHLAAARALEKFEDASCSKLPPKTRAVCPLVGQVAAAQPIDGGVSITPTADVNRDALLAHVRCHLAYAATMGHAGMDACPLYVPGVTLEEADGKLVLQASEPDGVAAVRLRTATHVQ